MCKTTTSCWRHSESETAVKLIDCDVHAQATEPMLAEHLGPWARAQLEHYGRRTPRITDWYPRARNGGMRVDAWPNKPGHIWGSDPEMLREQLLDEYDMDYAILEVLSGQDCYDHPDFSREWNHAINQWQLETWLEFDPRLRATIAVAHEYPELAVKEIERRADDERFVAVLLPASAAEPLGAPKYWPIYRAATECGRPVVVHTGGYVDHRGAGYPVLLPRLPRGQRHRDPGPAHQHGRRRAVRGGARRARGHDRVGRRLGGGAALVAGRRLGADARRPPAAAAPAVGVHRRARVVHHPADRGARGPAASHVRDRAGQSARQAAVRHRLPALGLRLAQAGPAAGRSTRSCARRSCAATRSTSTASPGATAASAATAGGPAT